MEQKLKTIKHLWSIICSESVIDSQTNNASLHNIIEELRVEQNISTIEEKLDGKKVAVPINFEIITLWKKLIDKSKAVAFEFEIELIDPNGYTLGKFPRKIVIDKNLERLRFRTKFNALPISAPGDYIFKIKAREEQGEFIDVGEVLLTIRISIQKEVAGTKIAKKLSPQ